MIFVSTRNSIVNTDSVRGEAQIQFIPCYLTQDIRTINFINSVLFLNCLYQAYRNLVMSPKEREGNLVLYNIHNLSSAFL